MKYFIYITLFLLISILTNGQDSTITLSQFEVFSSQPNKILKTEIKEVGSFGWHTMNLFKTTDLTSGSSAYAIRMGKFSDWGIPPLVDPTVIYIDFSDVDTVIHVLEQFRMEAEKPKPTSVHFSYITSNDIKLSYAYDRLGNMWHFTMNKVYKSLRTSVPHTAISFNKKRFPEFIELLKKANATKW